MRKSFIWKIYSYVTTLQTDRSRVRFRMVSLEFFQSHYGPGVDSASNTNEYQVYFLGVKAAGA